MDDVSRTQQVITAARRARETGDIPAAFRLAKQLAQERPRDLAALSEYGGICRSMGMLDRARSLYEQMLAVDPGCIAGLNNLAVLRADCGDPAGADEMFRLALARAPGNRDIHANLLSNAQYLPGVSPAALHELHRGWDVAHGAEARLPGGPPPRASDLDRPLRIGFVSADFCHHPVAYFMLPLFQARDRAVMSIHCFAQGERPDHLTPQFKGLADTWDRIEHLSDREAADLVRTRHVDVLFDMAGHTLNNRLGVFALKPAALQVSWAGYVGTTGLSAMDHVLADRHQTPPEDEPYYVEKIVRLPHSYVPYAPPTGAPEVGPAPAATNGHVTFGAFHNPAKVNATVLAVWAEILARIPTSRLMLKFRGIDADTNRARIVQAMAAAGVEETRLTFSGGAGHRELLATYGQVDMALDPFPYSGGVTTCEALWMGVPVVTLRGATFAGRHATSYLTSVGLPDLIAETRDGYIATAVRLAADTARLAELRATMRARMAASPLLDHAGYARDFTAAMRNIWREYCAAAGVSV